MHLKQWWPAAVIAAIAILLYSFLAFHPAPPGADGYYYLKQIKSLSENGTFYFNDYSAAYLMPYILSIAGINVLSAFRMAVALTCALTIGGVGILARNYARAAGLSEKVSLNAAISAIAAASCSLFLHELALEFYKTCFSLTLLIWALVFYVSGADEKTIYKRIIVITFAVLSLLSHKSAFLIVFLFIASFIHKKASLKTILLGSVGMMITVSLFFIFYDRANEYALALLGFFSGPGPWYDWFISSTLHSNATIAFNIITVAVYLINRKEIDPAIRVPLDAIVVLSVICLHPFQTPGPESPAYRILLLSPAFTIPMFLLVFSKKRYSASFISIILLFFALQVIIEAKDLNGRFKKWPLLEADVIKVCDYVSPQDYLIAHHGLEFYIAYVTDIRSRQFNNEDPLKQTFRVAYIPDGRPGGAARKDIQSKRLLKIGEDYGLFKEGDWQAMVKKYQIRPHWKNPDKIRPSHIAAYN